MSNNPQGIPGFPGREQRMLNVGHGSFVRVDRIVGIFEAGSLPMKRWREAAVQANLLVDATKGRRTKSLILMDSNHVILSSIIPQTLQERLHNDRTTPSLNLMEREEGLFVS